MRDLEQNNEGDYTCSFKKDFVVSLASHHLIVKGVYYVWFELYCSNCVYEMFLPNYNNA